MADARNRHTPLPFSPDHAERIRQMFATPGAKIVCPQCDEELTTGLPIADAELAIEAALTIRLVFRHAPRHVRSRGGSSSCTRYSNWSRNACGER